MVIDLVYDAETAGPTRLLAAAEARGVVAIDGREVLLSTGARPVPHDDRLGPAAPVARRLLGLAEPAPRPLPPPAEAAPEPPAAPLAPLASDIPEDRAP